MSITVFRINYIFLLFILVSSIFFISDDINYINSTLLFITLALYIFNSLILKELKTLLTSFNKLFSTRGGVSLTSYLSDFNNIFNTVKSYYSDIKINDSIYLNISEHSGSDDFFSIFLKDLSIKVESRDIFLILYNPTTLIFEIVESNGIFNNLFNEIQYRDLVFLNKRSISNEDFNKIFFTELDSSHNINIITFNNDDTLASNRGDSTNYKLFAIYSKRNSSKDNNFEENSFSLIHFMSTAFSLHMNSAILNEKIHDLNLLNRIITTMEVNKNIDEVLHLFLTRLTANDGLGFNRALFFNLDEKSNNLFGAKAIGPLSKKEAHIKWSQLGECPIDLFFKPNSTSLEPIESLIHESTLYLSEDTYLSKKISNREIIHIKLNSSNFIEKNSTVLSSFNLSNFLMVPLYSYDNLIGLLIVDNAFDKKGYTIERSSSLLHFAKQTSLVINNLNLYERLETMAIEDGLTKLYNRRYFDVHLKQSSDRALRHNSSLSLVMIDIDFFKKYNDSNGHIAGDNVLKIIATIFKETLRNSDVVCRYGGEEFVFILPETDERGAFELADKIRKKVSEHDFPFGDRQPNSNVTISLGISSYPSLVDNIEFLKESADKALYASKHNGRNKSSIYNKNINY